MNRPALLMSLLALAALGLVACGGGDDDQTTAASKTKTAGSEKKSAADEPAAEKKPCGKLGRWRLVVEGDISCPAMERRRLPGFATGRTTASVARRTIRGSCSRPASRGASASGRGSATALLALALATGCGDDGHYTAQDVKQAREKGYDSGYADGRSRGRDESQEQEFARGRRYAFWFNEFRPGDWYVIRMAEGGRGTRLDRWRRMRPGESYQCLAFEKACTIRTVAGGGGGGGIDGNGECDPSYPDDCLDTNAIDYDCANREGDGPKYVSGPLRAPPPDPFGLDDNYDGIGCEGG
jgi:hypothetical protein